MDRIQKYNQRLLRNAARETRLITSIDVAAGRRIRVSSATWDDYWGQCGSWAREIAQLKTAWTAFIASPLTLAVPQQAAETAIAQLCQIAQNGAIALAGNRPGPPGPF